jgi:hypothetical protein
VTRAPDALAYRDLISRIADQEPHFGWSSNRPLVKLTKPFTDEELALVCSLHAQAVTDELALDPTLIARYLRREINSDQLLAHLREATERAVCEALISDVLAECDNRAERAYERQIEDFHDGGCMTPTERMLHDMGVARLLK